MRRISEGRGKTLCLHALRTQRWTTSAADLLCGGILVSLGLRGIAGAVQGRPAFLLLTLFGVCACALVCKHWFDMMSSTGRILFRPYARLIRFATLPGTIRTAVGAGDSGAVEIGFDRVGSVAVVDDDSSFGRSFRVVLQLSDPSDTVIPLDSDLDASQAQALQRKIECSLRAGVGAAARPASGRSDERPAAAHTYPALAVLRHGFRALTVIGALAFLSGLFVSVVPIAALDGFELPLGAPQGLLEDSQGRIIIGSKSYLRLQRYLPDGRFDRAWRAPAIKGDWRLAQDGANRFVLQSLPSGCWSVDERHVSGPRPCREDLVFMEPAAVRSAGGDRLKLEAWPLRVIRTSPAGSRRTVVSQGWFRNILRSPLPAFVLLLVGVSGSLIVRTRR